MTRSAREQQGRSSIVLSLDTHNVYPLNQATFGKADPAVFPLRCIYFAYWDEERGVKEYTPPTNGAAYVETE